MIRSFYPYKDHVLAYTSNKEIAIMFTTICKLVGLKANWIEKPRESGGDRYPYQITIRRKSGKGTPND